MTLDTPLPLARPPWSTTGRELESLCRKALHDYSMVDGVEKIAIALSGGKDSLSLLYLLHAMRGRGVPYFDLVAIHVNGEFSCGAGIEERWLSAICKQLEIPFITCPSQQKREELECYSCSRERRRLLFHAAKEAGATTIAFGHHRDDSAQTLLLNLLQKAEFAANLPKVLMHHYGVTIIRPLIYASEELTRLFAKQYGFARITCQCPVGQHSKRKQVEKLIQEMEEHFPHVRNNLAKAGLLYGSTKAATP